jgi:hypothetical protein
MERSNQNHQLRTTCLFTELTWNTSLDCNDVQGPIHHLGGTADCAAVPAGRLHQLLLRSFPGGPGMEHPMQCSGRELETFAGSRSGRARDGLRPNNYFIIVRTCQLTAHKVNNLHSSFVKIY